MKCIKTCYGEWVNPALVKHFGIKYSNDAHNAPNWLVVADGVILEKFAIEIAPSDEGIWKEQRWQETAEDRAKQQEWQEAQAVNRRKARAQACAWLAELVDKID